MVEHSIRLQDNCELHHARKRELTTPIEVHEHFSGPRRPIARSTQMTRANRRELERKLEQARRLAMEPTDPLTRERLAQLIEELEIQLCDQRRVA
jgi:TATA-binding protein-associated factor Taf7